MSELRVAKEFSPYLGGRYRADGPWSGEQFREDVLWPRLREAIGARAKLRIVFDGVAGMPTSFLEEAFGGLLRAHRELRINEINTALKLEAEDPELWPFIKLAERFMAQQASRH